MPLLYSRDKLHRKLQIIFSHSTKNIYISAQDVSLIKTVDLHCLSSNCSTPTLKFTIQCNNFTIKDERSVAIDFVYNLYYPLNSAIDRLNDSCCYSFFFIKEQVFLIVK